MVGLFRSRLCKLDVDVERRSGARGGGDGAVGSPTVPNLLPSETCTSNHTVSNEDDEISCVETYKALMAARVWH